MKCHSVWVSHVLRSQSWHAVVGVCCGTVAVDVGVWHPWDKTQGVFSWIPSIRVIWGEAELSFCYKEYDTGDSDGCMWWCSGQLDWIWASIFAPCLFSNGFPVLFGEHQQIPQVPIERAAVFYWKGEDFISQYVYMWNDEWHKDYWKNQSGINVLADKIAVSRESGVNFY